MADIVIVIAAEVAKALVKPAIRQGQYLFCVNKVVRDLDNEKEELISKRDSIQSLVEQAKQRTEIIEVAVNKWLNDVDSLLGEVAKLEQDVKESGCFQGWCPTWRRYRLCWEISKKTKRITAFKNGERFEPFSHPPPLPGIEYDTSKNFTYFESTKVAYNQLLEALKNDNIYMIGLYGMGGSGKTTLATEVGEKAKSDMNLFDQVISVTVSQTPNIRSIQGKMADMLNLKLEKETEEGRARELWSRLKAEKRVLIIVDDVWKKFNLKEIGLCLDDNKKLNFKILLTTRQRQVCVSMDCQKAILLDLLSKTEGWSLFTKHAGIGDGSPSNLLEVAQKVSDECKGLPIAIKAVASSLKEKGFDEWKVALERLRNPDRFDDNEEEGFTDAFTCLKLSYDYLRNKKAKMIFLMCSMFPEDHEISIEDLIRYGVGLGLSGDFISFDLARSCIRVGINKLVDSCLLFYYAEEGHVKMHDVVRDVALCIASREEDLKILMNLVNNLNAFAISSWYEETSLISYQLDAPRLEIVLLQTRNENSLDFSFASSDGVKELKVMSILNSYYSPSLLLLQSTQWLTNLRTLRLSGWNLSDMSFLVNLTTLEALDLRRCHFTELPKGMEKLDRLKLLDLSECKFSKKFNYEAIGSCSQLEELYAFGYIQGFPSQRMEDIVALPNLRRFVIQLGWFRRIYYEECTRVLHLREFNTSNLGVSKQNLLQRAEDVSLEKLHGGCKNIIPDMVRLVGDMKELIHLGFCFCLEIECLIDTTHHHAEPFQVDNSLPRLVKLELSEMFNLKEMCRGPPSLVLGFFKKLEQLFICCCPQLHSIFPEACSLCNLKILKIGDFGNITCHWKYIYCTTVISLFSVSVARSLQQLEELSIEGCKQLKHIVTSEGDDGTNTGDNSQLMLPNLKKLLVSYCPKLEFIFPVSFALQGLSQLQEIQICDASGLKYVFGQYDHGAHSSHGQITLPSLNVFQLYDLENLLGICPENYCMSYSFLVQLRCSGCPKLAISCINAIVSSKQRHLHLNRGVALDEDQQNHLTSNLQQLELHELPQLKFLWTGSTRRSVLSFQFLQLLELLGCSNMKFIFSMAVKRSLPELTSLSIYHCEKLEKIMAEDEEPQNLSNTRVCFPKLRKLVIKECNKLKSLFYVAVACHFPELESLDIEKCSQIEQAFGSKGGVGDESSQRWANEDGDRILFPKLRKLVLTSLPVFVEISRGFSLLQPMHQYLVIDCPRYSSTFAEANTSYQHTTTQEEYFDEEFSDGA